MATDFTPPEPPARILIIEPDAQMGLLTMGGMFENRADWSDTAEANLVEALREELDDLGHEGVVVEIDETDDLYQLTLLHTEVASTAILQGAGSFVPLPTKTEGWDWTLGPGAARLAEGRGGDLGLFVSSYAQFASGSRVATTLLLSVAIGGYVPSGDLRVTTASLVDLETGDIVWIGQRMGGDAREAVDAAEIVADLLDEAPLVP